MKKVLLGLLLTLPLVIGVSMGNAASLKIGVVDLQQIIAPQDNVVRQRLNQQYAERRDQIEAVEQTISEDTQRLNSEGSVMQQGEIAELQDSIEALQRNRTVMIENLQAEFSRNYNREMNQYLLEVKQKIDTFATENGYDLILQKDAIPYGSNTLDVTNSILDDMPDIR